MTRTPLHVQQSSSKAHTFACIMLGLMTQGTSVCGATLCPALLAERLGIELDGVKMKNKAQEIVNAHLRRQTCHIAIRVRSRLF